MALGPLWPTVRVASFYESTGILLYNCNAKVLHKGDLLKDMTYMPRLYKLSEKKYLTDNCSGDTNTHIAVIILSSCVGCAGERYF